MKAYRELSYLQQKEIEQGIRNGLRDEQISVFAGKRLNYLQMRLLRTAMEEGLDAETAALLADSRMPLSDMEEALNLIKEGHMPPALHRKRELPVLYSAAAAVPLLCSAILFHLLQPEAPLYLDLYSDEIRLTSGAVFEPERYVHSFTESADLTLPESFTAGQPGTRVVCYEVKDENRTVQKLMRIIICDETEPEIVLLKEEAEILRAGFSCRDFLLYAADETDGDLTDDVTCSSELTAEEYQDVEYTVADRSGNTAAAVLRVHINDADVPAQIPRLPAAGVSAAPAPSYEQNSEPAYEAGETYEQDAVETWTETINEGGGQVIVDHSW